MATCRQCKGSKRCTMCNGTGNMKSLVPHPDPKTVDKRTGSVKCQGCNGTGRCFQCNGTGRE